MLTTLPWKRTTGLDGDLHIYYKFLTLYHIALKLNLSWMILR